LKSIKTLLEKIKLVDMRMAQLKAGGISMSNLAQVEKLNTEGSGLEEAFTHVIEAIDKKKALELEEEGKRYAVVGIRVSDKKVVYLKLELLPIDKADELLAEKAKSGEFVVPAELKD